MQLWIKERMQSEVYSFEGGLHWIKPVVKTTCPKRPLLDYMYSLCQLNCSKAPLYKDHLLLVT